MNFRHGLLPRSGTSKELRGPEIAAVLRNKSSAPSIRNETHAEPSLGLLLLGEASMPQFARLKPSTQGMKG
jgi:hypothetical protein